jgi:glyoxylase-like metal-dependent hydrolase (beta-lactamase superfamily II)
MDGRHKDPEPWGGSPQREPPSSAISRRSFGEVEAAVINAGVLSGWAPFFAPGQEWITDDTDVDRDGTATGGLNWLYVNTGSAVVLIDPATFSPGQVIGRATLHAGLDLDGALGELGVSPEQVTHVVISHLHADHACGLVAPGSTEPRFPRAEHVVPARDWEAFIDRDADGSAHELLEQLGPVRDAGKLRLVDGDATVCDGVSVLDTPGESPGHLCVRIESPAGAVVYLGDLVHFPAEIHHLDWLAVAGRDADMLIASRRKVFGQARPDTTFVYTHATFPAWGRLGPATADGWTWRYLD